MHGYGTYVWRDGREYKGEFYNDKKHGNGIFRWADGKVYNGEWSNGKQHGEGKLIKPDGTYKIALFQDGVKIEVIKRFNKKAKEKRNKNRKHRRRISYHK